MMPCHPRTRGFSVLSRDPVTGAEVSPAHAGIFASINTRHAWWMRVTRICGDFRPVLRSRRAMWFVTRTRGDFRIGQRRIDSLGVYHPIMLAFPPVNRGGGSWLVLSPTHAGIFGFRPAAGLHKGRVSPARAGIIARAWPARSARWSVVTRTRGDFCSRWL